jgi:predicted dehydrogenase
MSALRVGVIGAGSMGSLHARVVAQSSATELAWVADTAEDRGRAVAERFESRWVAEPELDGVDAVLIAAPTEHHFELASTVIAAGLPLLLEKPLAIELDQSIELIDAARKSESILMCGLLERFNPAVRTATEITRDPIRVATVRHSPYTSRIRSGVTTDLIIHDADILLRLIGEEPSSVSAQFGAFHPNRDTDYEDIVEAVARFPNGAVASLSANRLSQQKVRTLTITELDRTIDVDLLRQGITIYRNVENATFDESAGYSQQTIIEIPVVRYRGEPLQLQLGHFVDLIEERADRVAELDSILPPHVFVERILTSPRETS